MKPVITASLAFLALGGTALAQAPTAPSAPTLEGRAGESSNIPAQPAQGNGSGSGLAPAAIATPGAGNGQQVDSEFRDLKVGADGRAPLTSPRDALLPGSRAPSQPPG